MRGDAFVTHRFFRHLNSFIKESARILDLGSGTAFGFEYYCNSVNPAAELWAGDRLIPSYVPDYITAYRQVDLETPITIGKEESFDLVCFFEVIEHLDKTDALMKNAIRYCRRGGFIAFSFPNLASLFSRIEILMGYQPHILEVSNDRANCGSGLFGRLNNPTDIPIHHIRGITLQAGRDLARHHGLNIRRVIGASSGISDYVWRFVPHIAPVALLICQKPFVA